MKAPDEIKNGLECCSTGKCEWDNGCPYMSSRACAVDLKADALAYNQQLEAQNAEQAERIQQLEDHLREAMKKIEQLEAERDAAVALIPRVCRYCNHDGTADYYVDSVCDYCLNGNTRWEWRGVQKEE